MGDELPFYEKRIVYQVSGMGDVSVQRDLVYSNIGHVGLRMDVYLPKGLPDDMRVPGVVFIHGGPISADLPCPKDWQAFVSYGELVAASGLVGITFNHRFFSPDDLEQAARDISAAIAYARRRADTFHLDPERLCLWAFSGGGDFLGPPLHEGHLLCVAWSLIMPSSTYAIWK